VNSGLHLTDFGGVSISVDSATVDAHSHASQAAAGG
jgi:hypothetical protein